jgi:hypothetical protein
MPDGAASPTALAQQDAGTHAPIGLDRGEAGMGVKSVTNDPMNSGMGCLLSGNRSGDPRLSPRCGARNRAGHPCRAPAMKNGRCRSHGGKSTGPKTPEGKAAHLRAVTVYGYRGELGRVMAKVRGEILGRVRLQLALLKGGMVGTRRETRG